MFGSHASAAPWVPTSGLRWQYQLQGTIDTTICSVPADTTKPCVHPDVWDIDLYNDNNTPQTAVVKAIHTRGGHAVCYLDAGTWENWRPDANQFPASVKGRSNGWPGEKWLDIRRLDILSPILKARAAKCTSAGFDAIEWDNVDGYANSTGFPLKASDQLTFNKAIAAIAHDQGLSVGLKNDVDQLEALRPAFDWAMNEQCYQYSECSGYNTWTFTQKAVVEVEYSGRTSAFCPVANGYNRDAMLKTEDLFAKPWKPCR